MISTSFALPSRPQHPFDSSNADSLGLAFPPTVQFPALPPFGLGRWLVGSFTGMGGLHDSNSSSRIVATQIVIRQEKDGESDEVLCQDHHCCVGRLVQDVFTSRGGGTMTRELDWPCSQWALWVCKGISIMFIPCRIPLPSTPLPRHDCMHRNRTGPNADIIYRRHQRNADATKNHLDFEPFQYLGRRET